MKWKSCVPTTLACLINLGCMQNPTHSQTVEDIFQDEGLQALAQAACEGDVGEIEKFIADGVDVNARGRYDVTPIIWALTCENLEFPEHIRNEFILNGLEGQPDAVNPRRLAALEFLLSAGADPNQHINGDFGPVYPGASSYWIDGYTPVLIAAEFKDSAILELLLNYGGDPNARDRDQDHSALIRAFQRGNWLDLGDETPPFDSRQWANFYALLDAGARLDLKVSPGGDVIFPAALHRPGIALDVLQRYNYEGDLDLIARLMLSRLELGLSGEDQRRALLEHLETERGVDIDLILQQRQERSTALSD